MVLCWTAWASCGTGGWTPETWAWSTTTASYYLTGRAKDLIIRGGHNIESAVIEDALLAHPAVTNRPGRGPTGPPLR